MGSKVRLGHVAATLVAACSFAPKPTEGTDGHPPIDAPIILPDGGSCVGSSAECLADNTTLRTCAMAGSDPVDTACDWGCVDATLPAHCGQLVPTGSGAMAGDLGSGDLGSAVTIPDNTTINQMTGMINGGIRDAVIGVNHGIDFEVRNGIAVFRFSGLHIAGRVKFVHGPPVVLVSSTDIVIDGDVDAQGDCIGGKGGPGGFQAGAGHTTATGSGGGSGGAMMDKAQGGGGGGFGADGGSGGDDDGTTRPSGGTQFGDPTIVVLSGGGGGGGGGRGGNAFGGGGGGAIQLVANGAITINDNASINAGGCGGITGDTTGGGAGGGGGGAGGAILLEAHDIQIAGQLAVNGGGGGASNGPGNDQGDNAGLGRTSAQGSTQNTGGAVGGNGGFATSLTGFVGGSSNGFAGGGGGGVGRMRFNTRTGTATVDNTRLSPALDDSPTTCTQGVASTQ